MIDEHEVERIERDLEVQIDIDRAEAEARGLSPRELEALLREAERFVLCHPHYGDLIRTSYRGRGLGVQLRDDLHAAADGIREHTQKAGVKTRPTTKTDDVERAARIRDWLDEQMAEGKVGNKARDDEDFAALTRILDRLEAAEAALRWVASDYPAAIDAMPTALFQALRETP